VRSPARLDHLPWRIAGLVLLGVLVVAYQTEQDDLVHRLLIPVAMALATWLMVQNVAAVAIGGGLLAGIHSDPGSRDWIESIAYPVLAVTCAVIVVTVFARRFRRRIRDTHEARWRDRRAGLPPDDRR
jgi:uncharacterized membrane protein